MVKYGNDVKFYFIGYFLGGSLLILLIFMFCYWGVFFLFVILLVYIFGICGVMCGGDWLFEYFGFFLSYV